MSVTLVVTRATPTPAPAASPQSLTFDQPRIVIGRGAHADVRIPSRAVSDTHAVLRIEAAVLSVTDEGSTNGTAVNGVVLVRGRKKVLKHGDRIGLPGFEVTVQDSLAASDPPERTAQVARKLLSEALSAAGGEAAPPELQLKTSKRAGQTWRFPPAPSRLVAGRGDVCEVVIDDPDCSRQHAEFLRDVDGVVVRDLGSKNGVVVSGRRLTERRLRDGDEVSFGRTVLRFADPSEELLRAFDAGVDDRAPVTEFLASMASAEAAQAAAAAPTAEVADSAVAPGGERESTGPKAAPVTDEKHPASKLPTPAQDAAPTRSRKATRAADWVVIALAIVILGVSVAALYFVLKGSPTPR